MTPSTLSSPPDDASPDDAPRADSPPEPGPGRALDALRRADALGKAATRLSAQAIWQRPTLLGWRLGASLGEQAIVGAALLVVVAPLLAGWPGLGDAQALLAWLGLTWTRVQAPGFVLGAAGALAVASFARLLLDSWIEAGIWGYMRAHLGLPDAPSPKLRFSRLASPCVAQAMAWMVLRALLRLGLALLVGMTYVAVLSFGLSVGPALSALVTSLMYSALLVFLVGLGAMMELAPAVMMVRGQRLASSLLDALVLGLAHLVALYRVLGLCALLALLAAPLWAAAVSMELAAASAPASTLAAAQLVGALARLTSMAVLAMAVMLFRGATFALVAQVDGHLPTRDLTSAASPTSRYASLRGHHPTSITRQDFLPPVVTNVFSLRQLLRAPDAARDDEDDDADDDAPDSPDSPDSPDQSAVASWQDAAAAAAEATPDSSALAQPQDHASTSDPKG